MSDIIGQKLSGRRQWSITVQEAWIRRRANARRRFPLADKGQGRGLCPSPVRFSEEVFPNHVSQTEAAKGTRAGGADHRVSLFDAQPHWLAGIFPAALAHIRLYQPD